MLDLPKIDDPVAGAEDENPPMPAQLHLDSLQGPMEAIALGQESNEGRFCGYCYVRMARPRLVEGTRPTPVRCPICQVSTQKSSPVDRVPGEVLAIYMAKRRREGLVVNVFAFLGIFLALVLSAMLWFLTPENWWKVLPFVVLTFGSYYLARVLGYNAGVPLGSRSGRAIRDQRWLGFVRQRQLAALSPAGNGSAKQLENMAGPTSAGRTGDTRA